MPDPVPDHLKIQGRPKRATTEFDPGDRLYVGFDQEDLDDETGELKIEVIRFPDFSCNWSRFSLPVDVRLRKNGKPTDGSFSFTVEVARYKSLATAVHDPVSEEDYENYAHVEVRELVAGENIYSEPPKGRKLRSKIHKSRRLEYRQNILNNYTIELPVGG